jgi:MFS family permease
MRIADPVGDQTAPPSQSSDAARSTGILVPIAVGAVCGLAWAASMRGWMIQIAGDESTFRWYGTFLLILLPGAGLGALLGWARHLQQTRRLSGRRRRWLIASPLLLAAALLDPRIFNLLITNGMGGGALGVVIIGITGGYALSGRGPRTARSISGLVATLLILACGSIPAANAALTTPHGAWVTTQVVSLLGVLCVACSIPYRTKK